LTIAVILVLGILWVAVLVPPILRARGAQSRSDSVGDFHHKLRSLGQANGHRTRPRRTTASSPIFVPNHAGPSSMTAQQKRRRDVLFVLLGLVAFTFFLAVLTRSMAFIALQLLADAALGGYVYLLLQYKQRSQDQRSKVRYLGAAYREPAPYANARYASGGYTPASSDAPRLVPLRQTASH
jgi:Flp pilus assembly protein TadB